MGHQGEEMERSLGEALARGGRTGPPEPWDLPPAVRSARGAAAVPSGLGERLSSVER
ncbi:MAG: hypothetical protein LBT40_02905 [Deltaproteobacteria bacterium]|nr:hypothetical protein [Deltaproteobacteria bacterium]